MQQLSYNNMDCIKLFIGVMLPFPGPERKAEIVSEYDQEIPQSQTADSPMAPQGRAAQPPRDTRKTN